MKKAVYSLYVIFGVGKIFEALRIPGAPWKQEKL